MIIRYPHTDKEREEVPEADLNHIGCEINLIKLLILKINIKYTPHSHIRLTQITQYYLHATCHAMFY